MWLNLMELSQSQDSGGETNLSLSILESQPHEEREIQHPVEVIKKKKILGCSEPHLKLIDSS